MTRLARRGDTAVNILRDALADAIADFLAMGATAGRVAERARIREAVLEEETLELATGVYVDLEAVLQDIDGQQDTRTVAAPGPRYEITLP